METPKSEQITAAYRRLKYALFSSHPHDLNLFGIRSANRDQSADRFDDLIGCIRFKADGEAILAIFPATTDPGLQALQRPTFPEAIRNGTAILKPGQYRSVYGLGSHGSGRWRHQALIQVRPMTIYRDANRDATLDTEGVSKETTGLYGINLHAASLWNVVDRIGNYSAGCQVVQRPQDFNALMSLCRLQQASRLGATFTYTLFTESQIWP